MTTPRFKSTLALLVAVTTMFSITFSPLLAAGNAEFNGRVLQVDGVSPQPGVVIVLLDTQNNDANEFRSEPTNDEGIFTIASAPAGTYTLLAETAAGAFLASDQFVLTEGSNRALSLTLATRTPTQLTEAGIGASGGSMSALMKWTIIGVIAGAAFYIVNEVIDDVDPASEF
jgi:hypothetical protein